MEQMQLTIHDHKKTPFGMYDIPAIINGYKYHNSDILNKLGVAFLDGENDLLKVVNDEELVYRFLMIFPAISAVLTKERYKYFTTHEDTMIRACSIRRIMNTKDFDLKITDFFSIEEMRKEEMIVLTEIFIVLSQTNNIDLIVDLIMTELEKDHLEDINMNVLVGAMGIKGKLPEFIKDSMVEHEIPQINKLAVYKPTNYRELQKSKAGLQIKDWVYNIYDIYSPFKDFTPKSEEEIEDFVFFTLFSRELSIESDEVKEEAYFNLYRKLVNTEIGIEFLKNNKLGQDLANKYKKTKAFKNLDKTITNFLVLGNI